MFTARADGSALPSRVRLFDADAGGTATDFLLDLFDDGSFVHRDAVAGDGVFSNTFTVNYATVGERFYQAQIEVGSTTQTFGTKVMAVDPPSAEVLQQRQDRSAQAQTQLSNLIGSGTPVAAALDQVRAGLLADPTNVAADTVATSGAGVYWQTPEGLGMGVLTTTPGVKSGTTGGTATGTASTTSGTEDDGQCQGSAIVLSPYFNDFEGTTNGDESDDIAAKLRANGYDVSDKYNSGVTVDDFKNLDQYDAVVISTHGDLWDAPSGPGSRGTDNRTVTLTGEPVSASGAVRYQADLAAGRVMEVAGVYALTPAFFDYYTGQMDGTIVYVSSCRGARSTAMARTFLNHGAGAYVGYTDYVAPSFASPRGVGMFDHLLGGGTVNTIPGVGDAESDGDPARFRLFRRDANAKLDPKCDLLKDTDLVVTYTWPVSQEDLDTGTTFLGGAVGYEGTGSPYMTFSGDDTSAGGAETIVVNLYQAFVDGQWMTTVPVVLKAGWFIPAGGSGPATVTVGLQNKTTQVTRRSVQFSINPGSQDGLAQTLVGTAQVTESGTAGNERVKFEII